MEFSIEFGGDPQDVTITASGAADPAAFVLMSDRLMSDPRFRPGLMFLIDVSAVDVTELPQSDVEEIAELGSVNTWHYPPRAVAMVATNPLTLAQTQVAIAHMGGRKSGHRAFATRDEAISWLRDEAA
jgi:hypothetical protein